ncbi:MAG: lysyl-tRNA synthetase class II, partial [Planctomycetota bacterium]
MTDLISPDRLAKLQALREAGIDPFPPRGIQGTPIEELKVGMGSVEEPGPMVGQRATISGRIISWRDFGKLIFCPIG